LPTFNNNGEADTVATNRNAAKPTKPLMTSATLERFSLRISIGTSDQRMWFASTARESINEVKEIKLMNEYIQHCRAGQRQERRRRHDTSS
jgi:hypothetical protein